MDRRSFNKIFGKYIEQDMLLPEEIELLENWHIEKGGISHQRQKWAVLETIDEDFPIFRTERVKVHLYPGRRTEIEAKILLGLDPQLPDY